MIDLADHRNDRKRKHGLRMTLTAQPSRSSLTLRVYWGVDVQDAAAWTQEPNVRVTLRYDPEKHAGEIARSKKGWRAVRLKARSVQLQIPYHGEVPADIGAVKIMRYLAGDGWIRFPWPWPRGALPPELEPPTELA